MKKEILKMVAGFKRFHKHFFNDESNVYNRLSTAGQKPKTLMIACSDSRVDPAIIFGSQPGELFTVRNVANLVPPYESNSGFHGVSSAIEFAVVNLKVDNIVVLGHRQCGGIRSLFQPENVEKGGFVQQWMKIAAPAKDIVMSKHAHDDLETQCKECEKETILISLKNLETFPFIKKAQQENGLELFGVYFDLENGHLWSYDAEKKNFEELTL